MSNLKINLDTSLPQQITEAIRAGTTLVGDDYSAEQISVWFAQEKEAFYSNDEGNSHVDPFYAYMRSLTCKLGKAALHHPNDATRSMLVLGPGPGLEVQELIAEDANWFITFVEASDNFRRELAETFPQSVVVPATESGMLQVESDSIDMVLTLSVLHHIPNVSFVLKELCRVLRPGGYAIIREPCSSMGDWRAPRSATPNERGISKHWMLASASIVRLAPVRSPIPILLHPLSLLVKKMRMAWLMHTSLYYYLDLALSRLVQLNDHYWRDNWYRKLGPSAYFYVLRKLPSDSRSS